jgi:dihydropteroate synthase
MAFVRFVAAEDVEALASHLVRAGAPSSAAERAASLTALLTGVGEDAGRALIAATDRTEHPIRLAGEPGVGQVWLLSGSRRQFSTLATTLRQEGLATAGLAEDIDLALARIVNVPPPIQIGRRRFVFGERTFVMGIVNVTPDSFYDGGRLADRDAAVRHGLDLARAGADILDVGGESTRPGAESVSAEEERARVVPMIEVLSRETDVPISVDTTKAAVAEAALGAGASMVNDISGFKFDENMAPVIARFGAAACAMHIQGVPRSMQSEPRYFDVVGEVYEYFVASIDAGVRAGIHRDRIFIDPGIGFGKTAGHNLFLLRHLRQFRTLGRPIIVGTSRKSFIGKLTGKEADGRLAGTLASVAASALGGADVVRVHDVAEAVDVVKVANAITRANEGGFLFSPH